MNKFFKYTLALALVLSFSALNGAEYLHHHDCHQEPPARDNHCQACIIQKSVQSLDVADSFIDIIPAYIQIKLVSIVSQVPAAKYYTFNTGRAPPIA